MAQLFNNKGHVVFGRFLVVFVRLFYSELFESGLLSIRARLRQTILSVLAQSVAVMLMQILRRQRWCGVFLSE